MSESSNAWRPLKKELDRLRWSHQRIESRVGAGIPDVNVHIPSVGDVWIELKYIFCTPLKNQAVNLGLRREQYIWLKEASEAGRSCYLVARVDNAWLAWGDAGSWDMAKHSWSWAELRERAVVDAGDPQQLLQQLVTHLMERRAILDKAQFEGYIQSLP